MKEPLRSSTSSTPQASGPSATAVERILGRGRRAESEGEAWRLLAISLDSPRKDPGVCRSTLVAEPRTGASGNLVSLMLSLIHSEERGLPTLLVDGSGGRRSLSAQLDADSVQGLFDALKDPSAPLASRIQALPGGLAFLPAGSPGPGRLGLLDPAALRKFLDRASPGYAEVLVASRGVLDDAATLTWAQSVDRVILVATEGATRIADMEEAQRRLASSGAPEIVTLLASRD